MTSNSKRTMPSASSTSPSVTVHAAPDTNVNAKTGAVNRTPGIRKMMMLQIARGIRSSGKPIIDIGKAFFIQAGDPTPPEGGHALAQGRHVSHPLSEFGY